MTSKAHLLDGLAEAIITVKTVFKPAPYYNLNSTLNQVGESSSRKNLGIRGWGNRGGCNPHLCFFHPNFGADSNNCVVDDPPTGNPPLLDVDIAADLRRVQILSFCPCSAPWSQCHLSYSRLIFFCGHRICRPFFFTSTSTLAA